MRVIRKPAKRNFSAIRKPIVRKTSKKVFSKRNFANISQDMLDAIEEAMKDGMDGRHEPFVDYGEDVHIDKEKNIIRLDTWLEIQTYLVLAVGIETDNVGEENRIKKAETISNNKELKRVYSAENMADWLNWDVIADGYDIEPEKLKQLWINNELDYDENPELVDSIDEAFLSNDQPNVMDLTVMIDTDKDTADVFLDIEDYNGFPWLHVYHSIIDLTGNEKVDTQNICNAIANACSCF